MAGTETATRTIDYDGAPIHLSGPADDRYFQSIALQPGASQGLRKVVRTFVREGAVVVDIGANIGVTASVFARHNPAAVHAVEPSPAMFPHLQETLRLNGADVVRAHNVALGSAPGRLKFFADTTAGAASHLITGETLARESDIEVPVTTLDALVAEAGITRIDLIKLDVEGFELDVLEGGKSTLATLKPPVFMEFNAFTMIAFANINPRDFLRRVLAIFPFVYRLYGDTPRQIASEQQVIGYLHDVLVAAGCVDDLLCTFTPLPDA